MDLCCDMLPFRVLENIFEHFASLLIIGSTGGVLIILLTWFRYRIEHNVRYVLDIRVNIGYDYDYNCFSIFEVWRQSSSWVLCCWYKKPAPAPVRTRLGSLSRARARLDSVASLSVPRTRARTWSDALLARIYAHRYSHPPEYEPPPPYHVALDVEMARDAPPEYTEYSDVLMLPGNKKSGDDSALETLV